MAYTVKYKGLEVTCDTLAELRALVNENPKKLSRNAVRYQKDPVYREQVKKQSREWHQKMKKRWK